MHARTQLTTGLSPKNNVYLSVSGKKKCPLQSTDENVDRYPAQTYRQQCSEKHHVAPGLQPAAEIEEGTNWLSVGELLGPVEDLEAWYCKESRGSRPFQVSA